MSKEKSPGKLSILTKLGYGAGTAGDSIPYTLFFTYFIFYLTDIAGVSAAIAGVISFLAIVWQGITGPVIGYLSDNSTNPKGRRRPLLAKIIVPYAIILVLLFAPVPMTGGLKAAYYLIMAMLLWTCYSGYKGPWDALGAELTDDYNERNNIRFFVALCAYPACMVAQSGAIEVVSIFSEKGKVKIGWLYAAVLCAAVTLICCLISWRATKGKEPIVTETTHVQKTGIVDLFRQYGSLLKIRAYRTLVIFQFVFLIGYTIMMNTTVYLLSYNAGLTESEQSVFWLANTATCIISLPLVTFIANKIDKKACIYIFTILYIATSVVFFFTGVTGFISALIFTFGVALATSAFFGIFYSLIYDCCEVYELVTGERREGGIMALAQFAQTMGSAVAGLIVGVLLTTIGYTGSGTESAETLHGILTITTLIPAGIVFVSLILLTRYKMTKEKFEKVKASIEDKKAGRDVDLSQFKDLI